MVGLCRTSWQGTTPATATQPTLFVFICVHLSSLAWPRHFFVDIALSYFAFHISHLRFTIILPGSFTSPPDLSPLLRLEGLRRNLAAISATPPPPAASSTLGSASALEQGMGEGLLMFSGQSIGELICIDCCVALIGYRGGLGGATTMTCSEVLGFKRICEKEGGRS